MTARDKLYAYAGTPCVLPESMLDEALDAYRAEVLREAEGKAREIVAKLWADGTTQKQVDRAGGARAVEWELGLMASGNDEPAAPDFYQPGQTYTYAYWQFRCDVVTTHPGTGRRTALGWFRANGGEWRSFNSTEDEWAEDAWKATVTEAEEVDR